MLQSNSAGELVTSGILLAAGLMVIATVGVPYMAVQSLYGFARSWGDVAPMVPRPGSYLLTGSSILWSDLSSKFPYPLVWEHRMFSGLSAIIPLVWFLLSKRARMRQPLAVPMLAAVVILFSVTLDLGGHTLYQALIYPIPGFFAIRALTRIILVMMLPLAILFGILVEDLLARKAHRFRFHSTAAVFCIFLAAECSLIRVGAVPPSVWRARLDAIGALLPKVLPPDAILAIATKPPTAGLNWELMLAQVDAEMAAVMLGINTLNGYSGVLPRLGKA